MSFKNQKQRKAVMARLKEGDIVRTPQLNLLGYYAGVSARGYRVRHQSKDREITIITKQRPVKVNMAGRRPVRMKGGRY